MADDYGMSDFGLQDPAMAQQGAQDDYYKMMALHAGSPQAMARLQMMMPFPGATNSPGIAQSQAVADQFKSVLGDVNANAPEDEDPTDRALRMNQALASGMVGVSPELAMRAANNAVKMQEAKTQQGLLSAETDRYNQQTAQAKTAQQAQRIVMAKIGKDENGLPTMDAVATLDPNAPDFAQQMAQVGADAAKNGDQVLPITADQFVNGKGAMATTRANALLQAAQLRANAALQAAIARGNRPGGLTGNNAMMAYRLMGAANAASQSIQNIAEMPFTSSSGEVLGPGAAPGSSFTDLTMYNLRNRLSPQDVQSYINATTGLSRSLAMLETQGGLQGLQTFADSLEKQFSIQSSDTRLTALQKLAEMRQVVEKNVELRLKDPTLPEEVRSVLQDSLDNLKAKVPWTVNDITKYRAASQKTPSLTFSQFANSKGIGDGAQAPALSPADSARLAAARDAIARGADPAKVRERLGPTLSGQL